MATAEGLNYENYSIIGSLEGPNKLPNMLLIAGGKMNMGCKTVGMITLTALQRMGVLG